MITVAGDGGWSTDVQEENVVNHCDIDERTPGENRERY
jgi:hypothetical protein